MGAIDFILNIVGLLLWSSWWSAKFDPLARTVPSTLPGTVRRAAPVRFKAWHFLAALAGLLFVRALFYWKIGGAVSWTARLDLIATSVPFQSDTSGSFFLRMLLYSVLSFLLTLALFYLWLLFLVIINRNADNGMQKLIRQMFGRLRNWPTWILLLLPIIGGVVGWLTVNPLLTKANLIPPSSFAQRLVQGALLGVASFLTLKLLIGVILGLYLLNSYVYLGDHPIWKFVNLTARHLMRPLRTLPLEIGKVDFTPVLAMVIVFLVAQSIENGITVSRWVILPKLSYFYKLTQ